MYVTDDQTCFSVYIDGQDGFYGWAFFHAKDAQRKNAGYKSCPTKCYSPHQCPGWVLFEVSFCNFSSLMSFLFVPGW